MQWVHTRECTETLTIVPVDSWASPCQPGSCSLCLSGNLGGIYHGPLGASPFPSVGEGVASTCSLRASQQWPIHLVLL